MASQLSEDKKNNKLYGESDKQKGEMITKNIDLKIDSLQKVIQRGRVDLSDVKEVASVTYDYMTACRNANVFPTGIGLANALGWSRAWFYRYIQQNDNETTKFLNVVLGEFADILLQAGLRKTADPILSIFILRNSGQGYSNDDNQQINLQNSNLIDNQMTEDEIIKKYSDLPE